MVWLVYVLCALTSLACSVLLFKAFARSRSRMLWWSGLCFALLTVTNTIVIIDYFVLGDDISLWPIRHVITLAALCALLYGLVFEER